MHPTKKKRGRNYFPSPCPLSKGLLRTIIGKVQLDLVFCVSLMTLKELRTVKTFFSVKEIMFNRDLAKLGDNFVNFIYSLAKSCTLKKFDGWKVPDKVLSQALREADMRSLVSHRASTHEIADGVEALIVHEWLFERISIEELVTILSEQLKTGDFSDRKKEERSALQAFTAVLLEIKKNFKSK